jgi:ABC-2 type transport system ATP-binding protein
MRTRLALAQALLPDPKLLILDEPADGLDPEGIHEMRQTIQRLARDLGLTILLSSHQLNEVEQLCTRIAVLKAGRKLFDGAVAEARRTLPLVRIVAEDFAAVRHVLTEERTLSRVVDDGLVELAAGVETDAVLRALVTAGVRVFELHRVEQTLESFYLELMQPPAGGKDSR